MTRYDPHPQAHDDARTFGPADAQRQPHDGMPHRGSCGDCGALLTVPNVVGTTQPDATDRRESDETGPGVPQPLTREAATGLGGALEALADDFADAWAQRRADAAGQAWRLAERNLRAVLAAHPADAPEAQEPSGDVVERAAQVIYQREYRTAMSEAYSQDSPGVRFAWSHAQTLAHAGLLADPEDERRWDDAYDWFNSELESVRGERNEAEARARRAEDALRELTEAAFRLCAAVDIHPERLRPTLRREADKCRQALDWAREALSAADQTSDATPSDGGDQ